MKTNTAHQVMMTNMIRRGTNSLMMIICPTPTGTMKKVMTMTMTMITVRQMVMEKRVTDFPMVTVKQIMTMTIASTIVG